jgi:citrate lyase subunit alpha / citrate CoA-transferase
VTCRTRKAVPAATAIADLKAELDRLCGVPARPVLSQDPVAVVKWVDGTILDTVWRV